MAFRPALLLIDFVNPLDFGGGERLAPRAEQAARHAGRLKQRALAEHVPVIYVNDSFGDWSGNFDLVVERCQRSGRGAPLLEAVRPGPGDRSILKPMHSAFYGTPLDFLLSELRVDALVLAGLQTHICVLFSAHDAYLRRFRLWIPEDCVASEHLRQHTTALTHAAEVTGADVQPESRYTDRSIVDVFGMIADGNRAGTASCSA